MEIQDKNIIRKEIKDSLNLYKENFIKDSEIIYNKIIKSSQYISANTILAYMALNDEVNLFPEKLSKQKDVFIPKVGISTSSMEFYKYKNKTVLSKGAYNIYEPDTKCDLFDINKPEKYNNILILVPGRAFTKDGKRLGRGKGYYDKYLQKILTNFSRSQITIAGVCFKPQILENIPTDIFDINMDIIFTTD